MRWFAAERAVLLAWAARADGDRPWKLAWTLDTFLYRQGPWHDLVAVCEAALATVRDERARAYAHPRLARAWTLLDRATEADRHYRQALEHYERSGDAEGQSGVHHEMAILCERQGRMPDALAHVERALAISGYGNANTLNTIGFYRAQLGDFAGALECCERALVLFQDSDAPDNVAAVWDSLGFIRHGLGEYDVAVDCYETALGMYRQIGDLYWVADTLVHLGDTHRACGCETRAVAVWREALAYASAWACCSPRPRRVSLGGDRAHPRAGPRNAGPPAEAGRPAVRSGAGARPRRPRPPGTAGLLVVAGAGASFIVPLNAIFVRRVTPDFRGRAMGVAASGLLVGQGLGFLVAGGAVQVGLAPATVVGLGGLLGTVAVLLTGSFTHRSLRPDPTAHL